MKKKGNNYNHKLPDIKKLKNLYFDKTMSASDISKRYNVTLGAVLIKFKRYNVKRRTLIEAQELIANHIELTNSQKEFIEGLLIGDGCIYPTKLKKSAAYSHTDKHREYIEWLIDEFTKQKIICCGVKIYSGTNCFTMKTKHYREFIKLRQRWYPNNKKQIPIDYQITPIGLFNWYIGDGSYHKYTNRKSGGEKVVLCSQFDQCGKKRLSLQLIDIGINNSVYQDSIYIKAESRKIFFKYMLKHKYSIPNCYKYKFPKED